ncbi:MAG: hypothetical protein L0211_07840 [Planctomycetaceae bacterium]|nr:hypothetical protein [Planctomycetaceae bacterium]
MATVNTIDVLNRLYILHHRSLAVYLHYAPPYQLARHARASAVLAQMVEDQTRTADKLATMILDANGQVDPGEFPMSFTGLHDLSLGYLLTQLIERQKKHIAACEKLADMLHLAPFAQAAAREAVGEAKGHLDNLIELAAEPAAA